MTLFLILQIGLEPEVQFVEVNLMAIKLRTINTGKFGLTTN